MSDRSSPVDSAKKKPGRSAWNSPSKPAPAVSVYLQDVDRSLQAAPATSYSNLRRRAPDGSKDFMIQKHVRHNLDTASETFQTIPPHEERDEVSSEQVNVLATPPVSYTKMAQRYEEFEAKLAAMDAKYEAKHAAAEAKHEAKHAAAEAKLAAAEAKHEAKHAASEAKHARSEVKHRVDAELALTVQLPLAAAEALMAPVPLDLLGRIEDDDEQARRNCAAWYRYHKKDHATLLSEWVGNTSSNNVDDFLAKTAAITQLRNTVAHMKGFGHLDDTIRRIHALVREHPTMPEGLGPEYVDALQIVSAYKNLMDNKESELAKIVDFQMHRERP